MIRYGVKNGGGRVVLNKIKPRKQSNSEIVRLLSQKKKKKMR